MPRQRFRVSLVIEVESSRRINEDEIRGTLKDAMNPNKIPDYVDQVRIFEVVERPANDDDPSIL